MKRRLLFDRYFLCGLIGSAGIGIVMILLHGPHKPQQYQ